VHGFGSEPGGDEQSPRRGPVRQWPRWTTSGLRRGAAQPARQPRVSDYGGAAFQLATAMLLALRPWVPETPCVSRAEAAGSRAVPPRQLSWPAPDRCPHSCTKRWGAVVGGSGGMGGALS
jgi:hypothetical protein